MVVKAMIYFRVKTCDKQLRDHRVRALSWTVATLFALHYRDLLCNFTGT